MSKQQLTKLGERIAASDPPAAEDLALLNQVIRAYQEILLTVEGKLAEMGLAATSRVKTRDVLIDKLRREHKMALARVQDLAGARIVIEGGRFEQDALAARIVEEFDPWTGNASKLIDRRANPSHGYRAVHVVVFPEKIPVEIQIRTELQNYWAQIIESLADRWGRGIRYGQPPDDPDKFAEGVQLSDGSRITRQAVLADLRDMSESIAAAEEEEFFLLTVDRRKIRSLEELIQARKVKTGNLRQDADLVYHDLRRNFKRTVRHLSKDRRKVGRIIRRTIPMVSNPEVEYVRDKLTACDLIVKGSLKEINSALKARIEESRGMLQRLGQYVERGGIR
ncbi:hypothetical protein [Micromonospora echinofusca]|uniref:hypothetical protein n=1 Tax=Micromonospora echinofusca TaxID=47858 RepID=UPI0033FB793F